MKSTIKLLALSISIIVLTVSCNKDEIRPQKKLELRFENNGHDKIENFNFKGKNIGDIRSGSVTKYYSFKQIQIMENYVMESASVKSEYGNIDAWISTGQESSWTELNSGRHTVDVSMFYGCGVGLSMQLKD